MVSPGLEKIYIVCGYTDMRKSIDGLCAVIEDQFKMDPSSVLSSCSVEEDGTGLKPCSGTRRFVLIYKRLSVRGYQWPREAIRRSESFLAGSLTG